MRVVVVVRIVRVDAVEATHRVAISGVCARRTQARLAWIRIVTIQVVRGILAVVVGLVRPERARGRTRCRNRRYRRPRRGWRLRGRTLVITSVRVAVEAAHRVALPRIVGVARRTEVHGA